MFRRDDWLCSFISDDLYQVRCSCKAVKRIIDLYAGHPLAKRKADQRAYTIHRFPTFVQDCEVWGEPMVLIPLPTWRVWRVREWWFVVRGRLWPRTEWRLMETHWLRSLSEMAKLENLLGGLCIYICETSIRCRSSIDSKYAPILGTIRTGGGGWKKIMYRYMTF